MDVADEIVGESHRIAAVRETVRRLLARQPVQQPLPPILIQGETGTGKGLVARVLHRHGARRRAPFVDVNCAAIPETLVEAELFGFERGAFTDAHRAKPGLFQAAHGGVLFLDEIGLLPDSMQAKLLTAIEEGCVRRLGSTRSERSDIWLITATNMDLRTAVAERRFREDLYHRIAVITLELPPLRELGQDIVRLANKFLARACEDYGLPPKRLAPAAEARLLAHGWPGNVRELANVMERAAVLTRGDVITADGLDVRGSGAHDVSMPRASATVASRDGVLRERLVAALEQTGWNISLTAARLGVARNTVYARLARFGLRPDARLGLTPPAAPAPATAVAPPDVPLHWDRRSVTFLRVHVDIADDGDASSSAGRALERAIAKVRAFAGRVEDVSASDLVAVFGLDSTDDAPRRAAYAAIATQLAAQRARESSTAVPAIRTGLHVASVRVGHVGDRLQIDATDKRSHTALVDRLLDAHDAGVTIVSEAAQAFLERRFDLTPVVDVPSGHGRAYRLIGSERRGLALSGAMTTFIGRQEELTALQRRVRAVRSGDGHVVAVAGEAGVGKSRLVFELARSEDLAGCLVLEAGSMSHGRSATYFVVTTLLRGYFGIDDRDTPDDIRDSVTDKLAVLDPALQRSVPAILSLLGAPSHDRAWQALDPSERRKRTFDALKGLLRAESERQPLVIILEDLHWIDAESEALLDVIVASLPTLAVLLVATYRPEYQDRWTSRSYYSRLQLGPLAPDSTEGFLTSLLGHDASLAPVTRLLASTTGRNPLFIEESVRTLVETGALRGHHGAYVLTRPVDALDVPGTVQAILAARIDRLSTQDKRLLETAAVIGTDVPVALLATVAHTTEDDVRARLARLQAAEFLFEKRLAGGADYVFKHALTHDAAYESIPAERRRRLHARAVAAIEQLHAGRLSEHAGRLAHHSARAERWDAAARYSKQAGLNAAAQHALRDAVAHFDEALRALSRVAPGRTTLEDAVDIRLARMPLVASLGDYRLAQQHLRELEDLAHELGDERRTGYVYRHRQNIANHAGRLDEALRSGARALDVARRVDEPRLQVVATMMLEQTHFMLGQHEQVVELAYRNLTALGGDGDDLGPDGPRPVYAGDRGWLVRSLAELGRFREAAEPAATARRMAETAQQPYAIAWACFAAGCLHNWMGQWDVARSECEHAIEVLQNAGWVATLPNVMALSAWAHARLGKWEEASRRAGEADALLDVARTQARTAGNSWSYFWLCRGYRLLGRMRDAERLLDRVLEPPTSAAEAYAAYLQADIAAHSDGWRNGGAEAAYRRAAALAATLQLRPLVAHCHLGLAHLLARADRPGEARDELLTATTMCRELDMEPWLRPSA